MQLKLCVASLDSPPSPPWWLQDDIWGFLVWSAPPDRFHQFACIFAMIWYVFAERIGSTTFFYYVLCHAPSALQSKKVKLCSCTIQYILVPTINLFMYIHTCTYKQWRTQRLLIKIHLICRASGGNVVCKLKCAWFSPIAQSALSISIRLNEPPGRSSLEELLRHMHQSF